MMWRARAISGRPYRGQCSSSRTHCNVARHPPSAALFALNHGHPFARAHCSTFREGTVAVYIARNNVYTKHVCVELPMEMGLSHTSVTSVKTHVPCECVQFDIRKDSAVRQKQKFP